MLQRTKNKRIRQFHKRYQELGNALLHDTMRECDVKPYTQESASLNRVFNRCYQEIFTEAIKMLSP